LTSNPVGDVTHFFHEGRPFSGVWALYCHLGPYAKHLALSDGHSSQHVADLHDITFARRPAEPYGVGFNPRHAGEGHGRLSVLGEIRVLDEQTKRVLVTVLALEGLETQYALVEVITWCEQAYRSAVFVLRPKLELLARV
jgi:hypothetical protein